MVVVDDPWGYPSQVGCGAKPCGDVGCAYPTAEAGPMSCPREGCECVGIAGDGGLCEGCYITTK